MTDFASLADRIAADNEGKAFWLPDVGHVRNVTLSLDEIDKVIDALHLAAETHNALVEPAPPPHEGRFDVMDTIDPDYAASFERERCQLCGSSNGHSISCVKIQRDHVDVAPAQTMITNALGRPDEDMRRASTGDGQVMEAAVRLTPVTATNSIPQEAVMDWLGLADYLDSLEGDLLANDADAIIADYTPPSVWADRIRAACSVTEGQSLPPDENFPDCGTRRERELYFALMGLSSAVLARFQGSCRNWIQGGIKTWPVVEKALRLDEASQHSSTDRGNAA